MSSADPHAPSSVIHATTVAVAGRAALICGASGQGKSSLALQMMAFGAGLVADDRTEIWAQSGDLMADVPKTITGQIEARGVGILSAPSVGPQKVGLMVDLDQVEKDRLPPLRQTQLLDVTLPVIFNSPSPHFPAAILLYLTQGRVA